MTWRSAITFRMRPEVEKVIGEIPYGERSDFINETLVKALNLKGELPQEAMKEKPELPLNPKILQSTADKSGKRRTASEATETCQKNTSTKSSEPQVMLKQLRKYLRCDKPTRPSP